jgi:HJR/Mrr/RecB family endonuclease
VYYVFPSITLTLFTRTGFPLALTEQSADRANNEVSAGAAVKKAAQQVETQAQILTTQLNNRVRGTKFCDVLP